MNGALAERRTYLSSSRLTPESVILNWLPLVRSAPSGFGGSGSQVDSARMNLASSFVNGFVNAAFGQDKLLTDDGNKWLYKNKDHGESEEEQAAAGLLGRTLWGWGGMVVRELSPNIFLWQNLTERPS